MKYTLAALTGVACLLLTTPAYSATRLVGGKHVLVQEVAPPGNYLSYQQVLGWGRSEREAVNSALENSQFVLAALLREQQPAVFYRPSVQFIRSKLMRGPAQAVPAEDGTIPAGRSTVTARAYAVTIALTPSDLEEIIRLQEQEHRLVVVEDRLWILAEGLALVLVALLAALGFFWLRGAMTRQGAASGGG